MKKLGIIAGQGRLPALLVETCKKQDRPYFILALEGQTEPTLLEDAPHKIVRLGAVGEALKTLKKEAVEEVVLAGRVNRPTVASLRPDLTATMWLAKLGSGIFSGDDALLSSIVRIMESEGFSVIGAHHVLTHLLACEGPLGKCKPGKQESKDIARGMKILRVLGEHDIGQALVVENDYVLGIEAAEGTDALIERCGALSQHVRGEGVLVKAKKPGQDTRADLPAIGLDTVQQAFSAGLAGIAVEAGSALVLDRDAVIRLADEKGIFVVGTTHV